MAEPLVSSNPCVPSGFSAESILRPHDLPAGLVADAAALTAVIAPFPMKINPYLLALIRKAGDPLGRQVLPHPDELKDVECGEDPLAEERQSPAPQILHRYLHRVVFLVSNQCAVHCRFCMRKRRVAGGRQVTQRLIDAGMDYIRGRSDINEVILSGGDPLMLADGCLLAILSNLRRIGHVKLLRIHSRIPSVWPQRVTPNLARRLAELHPLYINIHFNHPAEITPAAAAACGLLADAGIPLGSQTVLLRGVNDDAEVLRELFEALLRIRVRPYYLHQLDRVPGTAHFQVPLDRGLRLLAELRGRLSGMAMPHFMIDLPGGGGKVALTPDAIVEKHPTHWRVRNWQGLVYDYPCD
ncbi:MAG: KamA family radical SAM protein [Desulfatitalea sp.]